MQANDDDPGQAGKRNNCCVMCPTSNSNRILQAAVHAIGRFDPSALVGLIILTIRRLEQQFYFLITHLVIVQTRTNLVRVNLV